MLENLDALKDKIKVGQVLELPIRLEKETDVIDVIRRKVTVISKHKHLFRVKLKHITKSITYIQYAMYLNGKEKYF